jgi:hypothetical protein
MIMKMRDTKNALLILFAVIGLCAIFYAAWQAYQSREAEHDARRMFSAPAPSGLPDIFHTSPPPKQP